MFWNLFISRLKTQSCVNRKISSFLLESSSNNGNWANWPLLGPTMYIRIWLYRCWITFRSLSDVSYSDECRTKKAFQYVKKCCRFFVLYLSSVYQQTLNKFISNPILHSPKISETFRTTRERAKKLLKNSTLYQNNIT